MDKAFLVLDLNKFTVNLYLQIENIITTCLKQYFLTKPVNSIYEDLNKKTANHNGAITIPNNPKDYLKNSNDGNYTKEIKLFNEYDYGDMVIKPGYEGVIENDKRIFEYLIKDNKILGNNINKYIQPPIPHKVNDLDFIIKLLIKLSEKDALNSIYMTALLDLFVLLFCEDKVGIIKYGPLIYDFKLINDLRIVRNQYSHGGNKSKFITQLHRIQKNFHSDSFKFAFRYISFLRFLRDGIDVQLFKDD